MAYNKRITSEGKNQVLKLAFTDADAHPFSYCALGLSDSNGVEGSDEDFNEFPSDYGYQREKIDLDEDITNNQLKASCVFSDNNFNTDDGTTVGEIGLCDSFEGDNPTYFAFSKVPEIKKTGSVSLKYTWIINIE